MPLKEPPFSLPVAGKVPLIKLADASSVFSEMTLWPMQVSLMQARQGPIRRRTARSLWRHVGRVGRAGDSFMGGRKGVQRTVTSFRDGKR